jgi:hypothetical protein
MEKRILMVATSAFILACGATAAGAQQGPMMQQAQPQAPQERQLQGAQTPRPSVEEDDSGITAWHPGLGWRRYRDGGPGDAGFGMMRRGWVGESGVMQSGMMMRMLFALMDSDGDGTVSLQEFQAAHERIFKAMDANKDGVLTPEEIQSFLQGTRTSVPVRRPRD